MNKNIKNQRGVISVFAMASMLFFLLFMLGAYTAISRNNRIQKESNQELIELYSTEVNPQDTYDDMVAEWEEFVPVYTYDQVNLIKNNNTFCAIDGKVYFFSKINPSSTVKGDRKNYELKTNLVLTGEEAKYFSENSNGVSDTYANSKHLRVLLDGNNNSKNIHDAKSTTWTNLANTSERYNIYAGGNKIQSNLSWMVDSLSFNGSGNYVKCTNALGDLDNTFTYEIVFKTNNISAPCQCLIGNWNNGGGGLALTSGGALKGNLSLYNNIKRKVNSTGTSVEPNKITYAAMTFDGKTISLYKNGEKVTNDVDNTIELASTETIQYKTMGLVTHKIDDKQIQMGVNSFIGKTGEASSKSGITITTYFDNSPGNTMPGYRTTAGKNAPSYTINVSEGNTTSAGITYYRNMADISELKSKIKLKFHAGLQLVEQSGVKPFDIETVDEAELGDPNTKASFSIIATGSNSVVIRSNVGKINKWYFNNTEKLNSGINGEVEILGTYYYCFDGLTPGTMYDIRGEFSTENKAAIMQGSDLTTVCAGSSPDNKYDGDSSTLSNVGFNGLIYSIRVYDVALPSDSIKTNYLFDKNRFLITE